jgi:hypothetical protein
MDTAITPTRTYDVAIIHHQQAVANLDHIFTVVTKGVMPRLSISDIYFATDWTHFSGFPPYLQLPSLVKHFNVMARSGMMASRQNHPDLNELIFYWGVDRGHTFNIWFREIRFNAVAMICLWAHHQAVGDTEKYFPDDAGNKNAFWYSFILAVIELLADSENHGARKSFLELWAQSKYDLVFFVNRKAKSMRVACGILRGLMPPIDVVCKLIQTEGEID